MVSPLMEVRTCKTQAGFYVTNYIWPIPFQQVLWLGYGFLNLDFCHFENSWKIQVLTKKQKIGAILINYAQICLSKKIFGFVGTFKNI